MASRVMGSPWLLIWVFPELHPPFSRPGLPLDSPEKSLRLGFLRHWSQGGRGARPFRSVADREFARRRSEDGAIRLPVCQVPRDRRRFREEIWLEFALAIKPQGIVGDFREGDLYGRTRNGVA
ncbi:hypothetical protein MUK42_06239 [Musa troglodytarum]|uniref:Uncharacterized protein n=1 Tax=Musa troglodytarum TaxID=320322 RepID=A0A9E7GJZ0_9LILI|nr:hypothetical protein MUK42_06239 [Musa troglodytarum]